MQFVPYEQLKELEPHPLSLELYSTMNAKGLKEDIEQNGILVPIVIKQGTKTIISGSSRYRIAMELKIGAFVEEKSIDSEEAERQLVISFNRQRAKNGQQLFNESKLLKGIETEKQEQIRRAKISVSRSAETRENLPLSQPTREKVAQAIGLGSGKQLDKLEYVAEHKPQLLPRIMPGDMTINSAYVQAKRGEPTEDTPLMPEGLFSIIYADPPWKYGFAQSSTRAIESHYDSMTLQDICELEIPVADNAVLFLWGTNPKLKEALKVIEEWGFIYKTAMVWVKNKIGTGYYCREQHELLLIAGRGKTPIPQASLRPSSVITAPRLGHNRKPETVYNIIENMYPEPEYTKGDRLELFSRKAQPNWTAWGKEVEQ